MGKLGLYGAGGVLLGWPLIQTGKDLFNGQPVEIALANGVIAASGYNTTNGNLDKVAMRNAVIRDIFGAGLIITARKL
jgi:xanthosine utilization system XapX-like protein